jgi:hypothetical protein
VGVAQHTGNSAGAHCGSADGSGDCGRMVEGIPAGTFYQHGKTVFWDVHHGENAIILDLRDEHYDELIVEVKDTGAAMRMIQGALPKNKS